LSTLGQPFHPNDNPSGFRRRGRPRIGGQYRTDGDERKERPPQPSCSAAVLIFVLMRCLSRSTEEGCRNWHGRCIASGRARQMAPTVVICIYIEGPQVMKAPHRAGQAAKGPRTVWLLSESRNPLRTSILPLHVFTADFLCPRVWPVSTASGLEADVTASTSIRAPQKIDELLHDIDQTRSLDGTNRCRVKGGPISKAAPTRREEVDVGSHSTSASA